MDRTGFKTVAIILAGGSGSRMRSDITKQRMLLCGDTVLYHSVHAFDMCPDIDSIIVVVRNDELEEIHKELLCRVKKPINIIIGGNSRAESAKKGFLAVPTDADFVAIHDAARCLISPIDISKVVVSAYEFGSATASGLVYDTIKVVDSDGFIHSTLNRSELRRAMTPQVFAYQLYKKALENAEDLSIITDDNMLVEATGAQIKCVEVSLDNIKITEMSDLGYAEYLIKQRGENNE